MKLRYLTFILAFAAFNAAAAQETVRPEIRPVRYFIGIQPGLTIVPFDEYRSAFDVNILPLTLDYAVDRHWGLRIHTIWDLEFRPDNYPTVATTAGVEIAAKYHFALKNSEEGHRGFYLGPVITPAYHLQNQYYSMGLGAELGIAFLLGTQWSLSISAQAGMKIQFSPQNPFLRIIPYSIPVLTIGCWL